MPAPGEEGTMTAIIDPQDEDALDYATLDALRGDDDGYDGPYDHICPLCGPGRASEYNRTRPTLRTWRLGPGAISYNCQRCKVHGSALKPAPRLEQVGDKRRKQMEDRKHRIR
jgi:hypothetical protein